jgi:Ni/Co efflux regulator RcnB
MFWLLKVFATEQDGEGFIRIIAGMEGGMSDGNEERKEQEERRRWDERKNRDDDLDRDWPRDEERERRDSRAADSSA